MDEDMEPAPAIDEGRHSRTGPDSPPDDTCRFPMPSGRPCGQPERHARHRHEGHGPHEPLAYCHPWEAP